MEHENIMKVTQKVADATGVPVFDTPLTKSVKIASEMGFPIFLQIRTSWIEVFVSWHGTSSGYDVPLTITGKCRKLICRHHTGAKQFNEYDKLINYVIKYIKEKQEKFSNRDY